MNLCASVCPSRNQPHNHPSTNQAIIQSTNQPSKKPTSPSLPKHTKRTPPDQPAAPAPCWACSRHVGPQCAAATRDLLGNSCCSWPWLPQLGASFGMDFCVARSLWTGATCVRNELTGAAWMNRGTDLNENCLAHMFHEVELHWNFLDRTKWDDLDWTKGCIELTWSELIHVQWVELQWLELSWRKHFIDFNALNWAQLYTSRLS